MGQKLKIFWTFIIHLLITLPSVIYHGLYNMYYRISIGSDPTEIINDNMGKFAGSLGDQDVIIFIHGKGGHHSNFKPLIDNIMKSSKWKKLYYLRAISLGNNKRKRVDEEVNELKEKLKVYCNCRITLIGMSKGGVVALRYVTTYLDARIVKVITISSPIQGTEITKLISELSLSNRELGIDSKLIYDINNTIISIPLYHIVPSWDHLIIPSINAIHKSTPNNNYYIYNGLNSHLGIMYSYDVANKIIDWIQT